MKRMPVLFQLYVVMLLGLAAVVMFYNLPPVSVLFFGIAAAALGYVLFKTGP
jgi:hypothetical protein